jgi:hypothetical protein
VGLSRKSGLWILTGVSVRFIGRFDGGDGDYHRRHPSHIQVEGKQGFSAGHVPRGVTREETKQPRRRLLVSKTIEPDKFLKRETQFPFLYDPPKHWKEIKGVLILLGT